MCLKSKDVRRFNELVARLGQNKKITEKEYQFLKNNYYPVKQLNVKEYVLS